MYVYKITNVTNGNRYIGKTTRSPEHRWNQHCRETIRGKKTHLYNAMRKYGIGSFVLEVVECVAGDVRDLNIAEKKWISDLNPEYNMTPGGDGGWIYDQTGNTWVVSEQGRENMAKSRQENKETYDRAREVLIPKISGGNNYQSKYEIVTPWGTYFTWRDATTEAKRLRKEGRKDVITDRDTLRKYCKENVLLNAEGRRTHGPWRGKYTRDIGFDIQPKKEI